MTPRDTIAAAIAETISAHNDPMQAALAVMEMIEPKPLVWRRRLLSDGVCFEAVDQAGQTYVVSSYINGPWNWRIIGTHKRHYIEGDHNAAMKAADADNLVRFWASTSVGGGE